MVSITVLLEEAMLFKCVSNSSEDEESRPNERKLDFKYYTAFIPYYMYIYRYFSFFIHSLLLLCLGINKNYLPSIFFYCMYM